MHFPDCIAPARLGRSAPAAAFAALVLFVACGEPEKAPEQTPPRMVAGQPRIFPADGLRLRGPGDIVLAEGNHGIQLTLAEYNARVHESPLQADMDTFAARRETLQRLVYHKVVAAEGRLRGYGTQGATTTLDEEIVLARQVMQAGMTDAQNVGDDQAREYHKLHPEKFPDISPEELDEPTTLMHVKFTMHNENWRKQVARWSERENVIVHRDRFDQLQSAASSPDSSEAKESRS